MLRPLTAMQLVRNCVQIGGWHSQPSSKLQFYVGGFALLLLYHIKALCQL